jgi:alcohol dehydrogenase (cytochrome c)
MKKPFVKRLLIVIGALVVIGGIGGFALYKLFPVQVSNMGGLARIYLLTLHLPKGTLTTETNPTYKAAATPVSAAPPVKAVSDEWPSYNRTLTSERFSPLDQINTSNVHKLRVLCVYDTKKIGAFESGLIVVRGALIGTTQHDIFSINPETCKENWRTHEPGPSSLLPVNRGAAYMDGMLFRGDLDGRVLAYDFNTGKRIWATTISDPKRGETVPAAPIAWNGLVFIGNAGGDFKGGKGHMYALDGKTGKVLWQFFLVPRDPGDVVRGPLPPSPLDNSSWGPRKPNLPISGGGAWTSYSLDPDAGLLYVPVGNAAPDFVIQAREGSDLMTDSVAVLDARTGAYRKHYQFLNRDWHDWDASNPPALIRTAGGKRLMAAAPKDGYLYAYDLSDDRLLYKVPATTISNVREPFSPNKDVHFCPGSGGGAEWNGPAFDPHNNLILLGEVDWCVTVKAQTEKELEDTAIGQPWFGERALNPFWAGGHKQVRGDHHWRGWLHAFDAESGQWKWRIRTNYPILGGVTPTAGGVTFFGDVGGNFYAVETATGRKLWGQKIGGGIGGGVITYKVNGRQRVAATSGFNNLFWPVQITSGKIVVLGL